MNIKKSSVLACVTGQFNCDRIISTAGVLAEEKNYELHVLCVLNPNDNYVSICSELDYLFQVTKAHKGDMTIIFNKNSSIATANFAKQSCSRRIVTGMHDGKSDGFLVKFNELLPNMPITMVDTDNTIYSMEKVNQGV